MSWNERVELLVEKKNMEKIKKAHILVVGLGGVGSFAAESLCRMGIGNLTIADSDLVSESNRNRQIISLSSTTGKKKTEVLKDRLMDINPEVKIIAIDLFLIDEKITTLLDGAKFDYVIDAIDTLTPKTQLLEQCVKKNIKVVSSMGSGAKFDPSKIELKDISKTHKCPLARKIRNNLHKLGIYKGIQCVFSAEEYLNYKFVKTDGASNQKSIIGSTSYIPPMFGGFCVSAVIKEILNL